MRKMKLKRPIEINGAKVRSLTFRRPTFGDTVKLLAAENLEAGLIVLGLDLAGLTGEAAIRLDLEDFGRLFVHLEAELTRLGINAATTVSE